VGQEEDETEDSAAEGGSHLLLRVLPARWGSVHDVMRTSIASLAAGVESGHQRGVYA